MLQGINADSAERLGNIMEKAAALFAKQADFESKETFADCVGITFWKEFGSHEQSVVMQDVYCILCDMGFPPVESHRG